MNGIDPRRLRPRLDDLDPRPTTEKDHAPAKRSLDELPAPSLPPDVVRRLVELKAKQGLANGDSFIARPVLVVDGMSPADVKQSINVGDCTLESTLTSLARTEKGRAWLMSRVKAVPDASGEVGKFIVTLKVKDASGNFVDKPVDVDPHFFVHGHPGSTLSDREVWPLVFEAAIAKEAGGVPTMETTYANMPSATAFLTGKPAKDAVVKKDPTLEADLLADFAAGKIQTLNTAAVPSPNPLGVVPNHAYAVVDVKPNQPVKQPDGTTKLETLVWVKNPWGHDDPRPMTVAEAKAAFDTYSVGDVP